MSINNLDTKPYKTYYQGGQVKVEGMLRFYKYHFIKLQI